MTTLNNLAHDFALSLGIPIGSPEWVAGGSPAWAASTGGHACYGWDHKHLIAQGKTKAILSNCAARSHWEPALLRQNSYEMAGIGVGVNPATVPWMLTTDDTPVSNQDLSHFHLGPLFAVYDHSTESVNFLGIDIPAKDIAALMIRLSMASCAGMVRSTSTSYWVGDRAAANILKAAYHAKKRGLLWLQDEAALAKFFLQCVERWEKTTLPYQPDGAKHASMMSTQVAGDLTKFQMLPNGLYWWLPVLWDIQDDLPGELHEQAVDILTTRSYCILNLHKITGHAAEVGGITATTEDWSDAVPYEGPFLSMWGARAMDVAAEVTGDAGLKAYAQTLLQQATQEWAVTAWGVSVGVGTKP